VNKGIRFTDEFKRDAVAQVVERGYAVSEVAERLGISTKSLYTWKTPFSKPPRERTEILDQAAEIRRLKRELARVTEERTILKKATAYFARESQ
jgi:transposase